MLVGGYSGLPTLMDAVAGHNGKSLIADAGILFGDDIVPVPGQPARSTAPRVDLAARPAAVRCRTLARTARFATWSPTPDGAPGWTCGPTPASASRGSPTTCPSPAARLNRPAFAPFGGPAPGPVPYPGAPPYGAPWYAPDGTPLYPGLPPATPPGGRVNPARRRRGPKPFVVRASGAGAAVTVAVAPGATAAVATGDCSGRRIRPLTAGNDRERQTCERIGAARCGASPSTWRCAWSGAFGCSLVFGQLRFQPEKTYNAHFANVSGLRERQLRPHRRCRGGQGQKDFDPARFDSALSSSPSTPLRCSPRARSAAIRYDDLIGGRYLALEEGAGGVKTAPFRGHDPAEPAPSRRWIWTH